MKGLTTWLAASVESVLPSTSAAACISPSEHCSTEVIVNRGRPETYHRYCHTSCHGKVTGCTAWSPGGCS
jgi:hypothetical protein